MMFLCSVASELSNYDSCQSVHFYVLIQLHFVWSCNRGQSMGDSSRKCRDFRFERRLWEPEVLKVHEFLTEPLSMDGKFAVKLSIT